MQTVLWKKTGVFMLVISFMFTTFPAASYAGLVGTEKLLSADTRSQQMTEIRNVLARDDVRTQMLDLGVNPAHVDERLNALTDVELARLSSGM
ncbi:MAG TPA: PA2779 family protein [Gammaproteobacteria bacterium]|nr:PA2779 family protein [Gammaproteobacteria bacterium]